jgi:hypothetical protein
MHVDGSNIASHHGQLWEEKQQKKVFPIHTPSILHGALVGAGSLWLSVCYISESNGKTHS